MSMDLKKLDPMARKMRSHVDAFYKALEENNTNGAYDHINEVRKFAEYLSEDVSSAITKAHLAVAHDGVNDIYAGGVPVLKMTNDVKNVHASTTNTLPGTVRTQRTGNMNRRLNNRTI